MNYYWEGLDFGISKKRGLFEVTNPQGLPAGAMALLVCRLHTEAPRAGTRLRVFDGVTGTARGCYVDPAQLTSFAHCVNARRGDRIEVQLQADR